MKITRAIIPAAGLGTRLRPLTNLMPKEMLPLGGQVVLQHVIHECDRAGLDSILVVINRQKTALFPVAEETPGPSDEITGVPERQVYFANQEKQGGLAHALLHGEKFAGDQHFAVALGDTVIHGGQGDLLARMIDQHLRHGAAATIAVQQIHDDTISRYGVVDPEGAPEDSFKVRAIIEKPAAAEAPSRFAVTARYILSPAVFAACRDARASSRGEIELTRVLTLMAREGAAVLAVPLGPDEQRLDVGNLESYSAAFSKLTPGNLGE